MSDLTRRRFLGAGLSAAALAGLGLVPAGLAAPGDVAVWGLDPEWGAADPTCTGTCGACSACRCHAANRIFASAADADAGRAHAACKCLVVRLATVDAAQWAALFTEQGTTVRGAVDRRWTWVQDILRRFRAIPAPARCGGAEPVLGGGGGSSGGGAAGTGAQPAGSPGTPSATGEQNGPRCGNGGPGDGIVSARVHRTWVRGGRPAGAARRTVYADLSSEEPVEALLALLRGEAVVGTLRLPCLRGRCVARIVVPETVPGGRTTLRIELRDGTTAKVVNRWVRLPKRRRTAVAR